MTEVVAPVFQLKLVAPFAVRVLEEPLQIGFILAAAVTVGSGTTTSCKVLVPEQPPLFPVTV